MEINTSNYAMGAVVFQHDEEGQRVDVGYHSKALSKTEMNYDVFAREFLALIRGLGANRHLFEGAKMPIKIWSDHANLAKWQEIQPIPGKIARYMDFISCFDFEIYHLPGKKNTVADTLSRRPDHIPPEWNQQMGVPLPNHL